MSRKRQRGEWAEAEYSVLSDRVHPSLPLSGHLSLKGRDYLLQGSRNEACSILGAFHVGAVLGEDHNAGAGIDTLRVE